MVNGIKETTVSVEDMCMKLCNLGNDSVSKC